MTSERATESAASVSPGGPARCAACGRAGLEAALSVAGDAGPQGLIPTTDRFGTAVADIVRCRGCGHLQVARAPDELSLLADYRDSESDDYIEEEAGQRATANWVLDRIERHTSPGALLDVGCWVGFTLAEAERRGWRALGIEPSGFASAYARERLALDVQTADLFTAELGGATFDAVILGDVIEHLPNPGRALERIEVLLRPGGVLAILTPDAGSRVARRMGRRWWSIIPTHLQFFTRGSLRTLLRSRGWRVLEVGTAPKTFSVRYYLGRIGGYSGPVATVLVRTAELARVADRLWAPDFRDRMLVIGRRPPPA